MRSKTPESDVKGWMWLRKKCGKGSRYLRRAATEEARIFMVEFPPEDENRKNLFFKLQKKKKKKLKRHNNLI